MQGDGQQLDWGGPGAWKKGWWVWERGSSTGSWRGFLTGVLHIAALSAIFWCPSVLSPPGPDAHQLWYNPFTAVCLRPAHHCCAPLPALATLLL